MTTIAPPITANVGQTSAYIEIKYEPNSEDPARVFRAMAKLIDAFHEVDRDLLHGVAPGLEPVLVLERVEASSIRAWLGTLIREVDDDALKNLDWKPLIGQYLVRGKHWLLRWLSDRDTMPTRAELSQLQAGLQELAPGSAPDQLLLPDRVPADRLLEDIKHITDALSELHPDDTVVYASNEETTEIDTGLRLSDEAIELVLTEEIVPSESELVLLVKKPDYLGSSRWEFRYEDRAIEAKMLDEPWLERFRAGAVTLRPGDSLRAIVRSEMHRGFEGNVVAVHHEVVRVLEIVRYRGPDQIPLLP